MIQLDAEFKVTLDGILRYLHAVCGYLNIHGLEGYSTIVTKCEKRANPPALIVLMTCSVSTLGAFFALINASTTQQSEILAYYRPVTHVDETQSTDTQASLSTARLGHELRTPLTAIIGFADCLGDPAIIASDDPKRSDYARIIATSARHMLDVVNGMSGAATPQPTAEIISTGSDAIDLAELIEESVGIMRLNVEAQRASLQWVVEEDVPVLIGSRHAFRQILINLISNALKFAPEGSVLVRASRDGAKVRLTVEDNGMGVAGEDLARLGEPFFRGRMASEHGPDGQGLGLGIVLS
jgi:signal transduction histidine kinase